MNILIALAVSGLRRPIKAADADRPFNPLDDFVGRLRFSLTKEDEVGDGSSAVAHLDYTLKVDDLEMDVTVTESATAVGSLKNAVFDANAGLVRPPFTDDIKKLVAGGFKLTQAIARSTVSIPLPAVAGPYSMNLLVCSRLGTGMVVGSKKTTEIKSGTSLAFMMWGTAPDPEREGHTDIQCTHFSSAELHSLAADYDKDKKPVDSDFENVSLAGAWVKQSGWLMKFVSNQLLSSGVGGIVTQLNSHQQALANAELGSDEMWNLIDPQM
jgi:hypothetical protein